MYGSAEPRIIPAACPADGEITVCFRKASQGALLYSQDLSRVCWAGPLISVLPPARTVRAPHLWTRSDRTCLVCAGLGP